jgi:hypothetical protein
MLSTLTYLYTVIYKYVRRIYYRDEYGGKHVITVPHARTYDDTSSLEEEVRIQGVRLPSLN